MSGPRPESGPPHPTVGSHLSGRYRLDQVIGRGAMGTVWAAYDEVLRRRVAVKQVNFPSGMPTHEVAQLADRTLREARSIAALSDPHVVTLFDILTLPTGPAIVMELLNAQSLAQLIKANGPLPDGQAATVGLGVAGGLMAAHSAGITHRDVKPANVLVTFDGAIKLTDFGIARGADEQTLTATGLLMGSPAYIAPEVASGHPATPLADAWGLGALLFACVEGRPPFDRGEPIATLTAVVSDPVPPHPHSGRLTALIDALLVKDPARRMPVEGAHKALTGLADDPVDVRLAISGVGVEAALAPRAVAHTTPAPIPVPPPWAGHGGLPPPPWAGHGALPPLPAHAPRKRRPLLIAAAVLAGLLAAGAGYFGVRFIAHESGADIAIIGAAPATHPVVAPADVAIIGAAPAAHLTAATTDQTSDGAGPLPVTAPSVRTPAGAGRPY